ncbi:MAG: site-specific integrase [Ruminococcus sp.]|nr:site-specific integrase [Ruminococcus sp.]
MRKKTKKLSAVRLPSGNYRCQIRVTMPDGSSVRKSFTAADPDDAIQLAREYKAEKRIPVRKTFADALDLYIASRESTRSPSTIRSYRSIQRTLLADYPVLAKAQLDTINSDDVQNVIDDLIKKHKSPKTIRNINGLITATLLYHDIKLRPSRLPQKERNNMQIPDDNTMQEILDYSKGTDLYIPIMLAAFGTLRRGEICALTMDDIQGNVVHVSKSLVQNPDGSFTLKPPKTFSSDRYVTMPDVVIQAIKKQGYVTKLTPDHISLHFTRLLRKHNLPPYRFHSLRHYSVSKMHLEGLPDAYIQHRGGWSSSYVMQTVYRHELDSAQQMMSAKANDAFVKLL